jgi:cytochrome c oxidase cbb3-type subunit 1
MLSDAARTYGDINQAMSTWFTVRTAGFGLLIVGHLAFLINFFWIACPIGSSGTAAAQFRAPPALSIAKAPASEGHA